MEVKNNWISKIVSILNFIVGKSSEEMSFSPKRSKAIFLISGVYLLKFIALIFYFHFFLPDLESHFFLYFYLLNTVFIAFIAVLNFLNLNLKVSLQWLFFSNVITVAETINFLMLANHLPDLWEMYVYFSIGLIVATVGLLPSTLFFLQGMLSYFFLVLIILIESIIHVLPEKQEFNLLLEKIGYISLVYFLISFFVFQFKKIRIYFFAKSKAGDNFEEEKKDLYAKAYFDFLTGLYNRAMMEKQLEHTIKRALFLKKGYLILLFMDINEFKKINDNLGHRAGDVCLVELARRTKTLLAKWNSRYKSIKNFCARLSGDEFIIMIYQQQDDSIEDAVKQLCVSIEKEMVSNKVRIEEENKSVQVLVSIGVVFFSMQKVNQDLGWEKIRSFVLSQADKNMYKAKASKITSYHITQNIPE